MNQTLLVRAPMGALLALALFAPGTAFAYRDKDAINDCESRIRSEYGVSDLRDARAEQIMQQFSMPARSVRIWRG